MNSNIDNQPSILKNDVSPTNTILPTQYSGIHCLICPKPPKSNKSPSAVPIPFIYMGKKREFLICKKSHFGNQEDYDLALERLNFSFDFIKNNGDNISNYYESGEEEETQKEDNKCHGYLDVQKTPCNVICGSVELYINLDDPYYFCKPSHLLWYILINYGLGGLTFTTNRHRSERVKKPKRKKKISDQPISGNIVVSSPENVL